MTDAEIMAELEALESVENQAALSDPASVMRRVLPGYRIRPHLMVISRALARLEDPDPANRVDRILIRVPPQTGKTVTAVVGASFWWLARHPRDRVIIGSYNSNLAVDRGRDVKKLVDEYGHIYNLVAERGSERIDDWRITSGGGVKSVGVGSGVTGSPGDFAIIDDPHKSREEADSLRLRDRAYRWLSADVISRLSPRAPIVMVLTPWHPDDLSARVLADQGRLDEGGRWLVVDMPALCSHPDRDPLGRLYGAPLTHPKIPTADVAAALRHWEDKRASSTVQDWSSLYMLDPRPAEGALVPRDLIRQRRCWAEGSPTGPCDTTPVKTAVAVDPSGGGRDTAGIIGGYLGKDRRMYITSDETAVMSAADWSRKACQLAEEIDADVIVFEANYGGDQALTLIRTAWDALRSEARDAARSELVAAEPGLSVRDVERRLDREPLPYSGLCPRIRSVRARKSKRLRAEPVSQQWIEDKIRTVRYLPELEEEWCTWQPDSTESPGRIDASVYLAYELLPTPKSSSDRARQQPMGSLPVTGMSPLASGGGITGFGPLG